MKKLDDIPKKNVFTTPDGYFDRLPTVIQSRMTAESKKAPSRVFALNLLRIGVPVAALAVLAIVWFRPAPCIECQVGEVDADQIALFLEQADWSSDDHVDVEEFTTGELDAIEDEVYSNFDSNELNDQLLDELDPDNL